MGIPGGNHTLGQLISMNSKKKYRPSLVRSSAENAGSVSRNNRNDGEFLPDYLTLNSGVLYCVIRCKNLLQAYFYHVLHFD